jgi:hypothetical protein
MMVLYTVTRQTSSCIWASAEVKNEWSCTSILPVCIHGVYRDNFTLTITFTSFDIGFCLCFQPDLIQEILT